MKKIKLLVLIAIIALTAFTASAFAIPEAVGLNSVGEMVVRVQIRLRELDYIYFKATGNFKGMTDTSVKRFQSAQVLSTGGALSPDGSVGDQTQQVLFSARAVRASIPESVHMPIGPSHSGSSSAAGTRVAWATVLEQLSPNKSYKVIDYNTGESFYMTFIGGENHGEFECTTPDDTAVFLEVFGGEFNYSKRPVVVKIGDTSVAASLFGYPHGEDSVEYNDMDGHTCIYFDGSLSNFSGLTDVEHQKQIYVAASSK